MRRFRFNIASLLAVVLFLAVGIAALREANDTWDSSLFSITISVLLISILLDIHRTEKRRAFWLGFALFGSAYMAISLAPLIESKLITTKVLDYLDSKIRDRSFVSLSRVWDTWSSQPNQNNQALPSASIAFSPQGNQFVFGDWTVTGNVVVTARGSTMSFIRIGHTLLAWIAAILGALLSQFFHRRSRERTSEEPNRTNRSDLAKHLTGPHQ
jgi:hypothetical protein